MKQNRGYPQLTVTKRAEHSIIKGKVGTGQLLRVRKI